MSWQTYVDDHLMCDLGRGVSLSSAAIIGLDGAVLAQSTSFPQITPQEVTAIIDDFNETQSIAEKGLHIGGIKYMVMQGEAGAVIRGKKGSAGATIKKTACAIIIGVYEEPVTAGECNMVVERLGDYLIDQGI